MITLNDIPPADLVPSIEGAIASIERLYEAFSTEYTKEKGHEPDPRSQKNVYTRACYVYSHMQRYAQDENADVRRMVERVRVMLPFLRLCMGDPRVKIEGTKFYFTQEERT